MKKINVTHNSTQAFFSLLYLITMILFCYDKSNKEVTYEEKLIISFLRYPKPIPTEIPKFIAQAVPFSLCICAYTKNLVYLVF